MSPPMSDLHEPVLRWYDEHARDLPWRGAAASAVVGDGQRSSCSSRPRSRGCCPVHEQWLDALADARPTSPPSRAGEAVRAWGRLGYPRRALRLHAAATAIVERHDGEVPASYDDLLALPGVGDYTAAAIATFAYGRRHVVLDTNVRRVLARAVTGRGVPGAVGAPRPSATLAAGAAARRRADRRDLVGRGHGARRAGLHRRQPALRRLPGAPTCARGGRPATRRTTARRARRRPGPGTDRQCRGRLLGGAARERGTGAPQPPRRRLVAGRRSGCAAWPAWSTTGWLVARQRGDLRPALTAPARTACRPSDRATVPRHRPEAGADRRVEQVGCRSLGDVGAALGVVGTGLDDVGRPTDRRPSRTAAGRAARRPSGPGR